MTILKAFRPVSLLATVSRSLEAVVANRLFFMVEDHGLLPRNHLGTRKKCEQAINILVERIYEAWRNKMVVPLVTSDVSGPSMELTMWCSRKRRSVSDLNQGCLVTTSTKHIHRCQLKEEKRWHRSD